MTEVPLAEVTPPAPAVAIGGRRLARSAFLNVGGQAVPVLAGIALIPPIVRGLGAERFGLLSLAWVALGYFAVFDLGLGRATTKLVAESFGKRQVDDVRGLIWTAVAGQAGLGILAALVFAGIAPTLIERVFRIPPHLVGEATVAFYLLALALPVLFVSGSFSGLLEGIQRFDLVNAVRVPSNLMVLLAPLLGLKLGLDLGGIIALILAARILAAGALIVLALRIVPSLKHVAPRLSLFPRLLSYGGWVTVSALVNPVLVYLERFLIASLWSMAAVAYYTAPYEVVTRLWVIPAGLTITLFPNFSVLGERGDRTGLETLLARAVKYILLVLGPVVLALVLYAHPMLGWWLGGEFATNSTRVLQILAVAVLANSAAQVPYALLQGVGRPDVPAKFHLVELPLYIAAAWLMVRTWGINGAAGAWAFRVVVDGMLLFSASIWVCRLSPRALSQAKLGAALTMILVYAGVASVLKMVARTQPVAAQLGVFAVLLVLFGLAAWRMALDSSDRHTLVKAVKLWS